MRNAEWITGLAGKTLDLSHSEFESIQTMLSDGDLIHIDGPVVTALIDLADSGIAKYRGLMIVSNLNSYTVVSEIPGYISGQLGDAMEAIMCADDHLSGKHLLSADVYQVAS